ncbi:MAG: type II toxin-antitoxin system HicA family toxin [Ancalomicrobiaceae bacterium]|nr:type II toxin-antitoxin system HicA family toxin [Ancalomicrobiaceae bacterium]
MRKYVCMAEWGDAMPVFETNTRMIIARLEREGWINRGGANHDVFVHPTRKGRVVVPRHRELKLGTARSIAVAAGWEKDR